jgi:hypothetical protein
MLPADCQCCGVSTEQMSLSCHEKTVKPVYNGTARNRNIFRCMDFTFYTYTLISIKDSINCKILPLNTVFCHIPVPFNPFQSSDAK